MVLYSLGFPGEVEDPRVIGRVAKDEVGKAEYRAQWVKRQNLQFRNWNSGHMLRPVHLLLPVSCETMDSHLWAKHMKGILASTNHPQGELKCSVLK